MTAAQIRQQFLDFFASKQHSIVPSAPIVVKNDPTLMFTNAGMNQFKDYFLGNQTPASKRVADTQKCLRVSGKHNDLEEVGVDTYHHTMFEMLGNWSFGDYFKTEAISWSWELLTGVYQIPKDRLYVTVFEGDEKEGLPKDEEAATEWAKWIDPNRILLGNKKDNFWEMGDTGPCGPCTEIHVDCRPDAERAAVDGKTLVNNDHPQVIEIWNNVFMQFNRLKDGSLQPLPAKHVDTGMGLERLVRVLQGKTSNYDTDLFTGTIAAVENITGAQYDFSDSKQAVAFRVLADHIRAISFTIADGQLPSNTGAGYVIRRILRRAVRYYYSYLGYKQPLLHQLVPVLAAQFEHVFPELKKQETFVGKVVLEEEEAFLRTLEKGLKKLDSIFENLRQMRREHVPFFPQHEIYSDNPNRVLSESEKTEYPFTFSGKEAFELYDTYGFPLDLTQLILAQNSIGFKFTIDENEFNSEMEKQKNRSRAATTLDTGDWQIVNETAGLGFVGYADLNVGTHVQKFRKVSAKGKDQYQLVLASTPFYAESGGQVGDTGELHFGDEIIQVLNTKKENDLIVHFVDSLPADISGDVRAVVHAERRLNTMYNHTATHLLHAALRQVLGTHVAQKGSLVNDEYLRFDFSHFSKMTDEEIRSVEKIVNDKIRENIPVVIESLPKEEALTRGAMALFGEKYGDVVRVVTIDPNYSVELCGGTHVMHTGMIGLFALASESAVAAGVRRIEAYTGPTAFRYFSERLLNIKGIGSLLKAKDPIKAVDKLLTENAQLKKHIEMLEARQLVAVRNELLQKDEIINGINFIGDIVEVGNADALKKLCFDLKNHLNDFVVVLAANIDGKPFVAVSIADNVVAAKGLDAGAIIKQHLAPIIKGGGGGQKNLATAGGQDASNLAQAIAVVKGLL
ncbi:alanine--tRNA ligase [Phnomibacter ginsenosidimutans]|uniref:Alanine--tRNA ligase n=2 Tax=Phnomibacter ginsenosidimutans TaxID=2676868 RepID=A0A6I6GB86_9BACT|nr:alanine--tRNA ligase [Phnomibacter ginsenosidimutans]